MCVMCLGTFLPPPRSKDHRWRLDPVSEEAVGCDDPHRVLSQRVRPHRPPALHGEPAAQVCLLAHQHHRVIPTQQQPRLRLGRVHLERE